ncbi:MAG: aldo/keto reductase [Deltaproteobacteria bacterium]|nr:aldo/keto reductase [Deltaproteobacteria bacterium]
MTDINSKIRLYNGLAMPRLGLGTWGLSGRDLELAAQTALEVGYRHFDTAAAYENETTLGQALNSSGLKREELFVVSKIWNSDQGEGLTERAYDDILSRLGLDKLDLCLLHWPVASKTLKAWECLSDLYAKGRVSAVGVANFDLAQLKWLLASSELKPMVNQIELHPYRSQTELTDFCREKGVVVSAYCPLARGKIKKNQFLQKIARRHEKTVAQVVLRWHFQNGLAFIPKSAQPDRIRQNADIYDFCLTPEEMAGLGKQNQDRSVLKPKFKFDSDGFIIEENQENQENQGN